MTAKLISAYNGRDALEILNQGQHFDLILLDINMPIMNGFDFLHQLEHVDVSFNIKMLSSSTSQSDIVRAFTYKNVNEYLVKPISKEMIIRLF